MKKGLVVQNGTLTGLPLAELDPVVERRHQELDALFSAPRLEDAIWHVGGRSDRGPVDWRKVLPV